MSDGTFRVVAKAIDPKTGKAKFRERYTREVDRTMGQNAAVAYRAELIDEIKTCTTRSDVPTVILRLFCGWRRCADPRGSPSLRKT